MPCFDYDKYYLRTMLWKRPRSRIMLHAVVLTTLYLLTNCVSAQDQVRMTLLSIRHFESEVNGEYQCHLSDPDMSGTTVTSYRAVDTRNDGVSKNPAPPPAQYQRSNNYPHYKVRLNDNGNDEWFGVFGCEAVKSGKKNTRISTTRMRSDAEIVPVNELFTQTVNIGDEDVSITMETDRGSNGLRWRKDNSGLISSQSDRATFFIPGPIQLSDAGTYECHYNGERNVAKQGLNLLLVRACPATRWGPPSCFGVCDSCYNGGICDENNGKCVCPPGFRGDNCLQICGGNRYGHTCEKRCSRSGNANSCRRYLFCLVHPFGCRCNTGWKGLDCNTECSDNTFGASCLQSCHCGSNQCDRYRGTCTGSTCKPGWTGNNCQECEENNFGTDCSHKCHCRKENCNVESGLCKPGGCLPEWVDLFHPYACQTGLQNITYTKMNAGVPVPVTCVAVEGPGGDLSNLQLVLSRDAENLEDGEITAGLISGDGTTRSFTVSNVQQGDTLYCQLRDDNEKQAVLSLSVEVFVLPILSSAPVNDSVDGSSVTISWSAWDENTDEGDPPLIGYIPYYKVADKINWITSGMVSPDTLTYTFTSLNPDTLYSFSVSAVREGNGGEGPRSPELSVRTICDVPSKPGSVTAKVIGEEQTDIEVSWQLPSGGVRCRSGFIKFTIYYSRETNVTSVDVIDPNVTSVILYNLSPGVSYTLYVTLTTSGGVSERSNEITQHVPDTLVNGSSNGSSPVVIAVSTTLSVLLILVIILLVVIIVWRRGRTKPLTTDYTTSDANNHSYASDIHEPENFCKNEEQREEEDDDEALYTNLDKPVSILIADLEKYIRDCENSRTAKLEQQFQLLNGGRQFPSLVGDKEQNKTKNRFKNMVAYDHSRVVLDIIDGDPHSDYYNANYIKNVENEVAFIASQGPNRASVGDFWRMVWKENVRNIVMLTNLIEDGKDRCIQYWPQAVGESKRFGEISLKLESDEQYGNYDIRKIQVKLGENIRVLTNWHFKTWPDKDVPDQPSPLIEFARRVKLNQKTAPGHLLVHCSAGVGRTGTYIALYTLMEVIETDTKIDIYGCVERMRQDRIKMVQTETQYKFLHECLLEVFLAGNTKIPVESMENFDIEANKENLKKQFKILARLDKRSATPRTATPEESEKSRYPKILPVDNMRPFLQTPGKTSRSNYINACLTTSYRKKDAFIATQSPLPATVEDFWRLIYDWKCPLIVMLNYLDPRDKTCCKYWPENNSSQFGNMKVKLKEEQDMGTYMHRQFELTEAFNEEPRLVQQMQVKSWDERNQQDITVLVRDMEKIQQDYSMIAPTVVHCINGVGRTGVFLTVKSEMERTCAEGIIDVFNTVRQLRGSNHSMVYTAEDYYLCHQLLNLEFPESHYANI